jgi:hypothetical protein
MSGIKTMAEMKQIAKNQSETIRQQNEILANQTKDLQMKAQQFEASRNADIRHQVNQCVDFALKSLPWWNRSPKAVVDRASTLLLTIKHEAAKHVAMEIMAQRIQEEVSNEPAVVDEITMDREGAEMEIK